MQPEVLQMFQDRLRAPFTAISGFSFEGLRFPSHHPAFPLLHLGLFPLMSAHAYNHARGIPPVPHIPMVPGMYSVQRRNNISPASTSSHLNPAVPFSHQDVDLALYEYTKTAPEDNTKNASTGIKSGDLSYGIDRILSDRCSSTPPSSSAVTQESSPRAQRREEKGEERMGTKHTLELPEGLVIRQTLVAGVPHYGVFCNKPLIEKGTKFGPFKGRIINAGEMKPPEENSSMWEEGKLSHFIDGRRNAGNWMALVNCARFAQEQNLVALQVEGDVFYEACRDIPQGRELLVWYGDAAYQPLMGGVPATRRERTENDSLKEAESSEGYQCERCGKVFAYRYYRDKHLKYTRCVDQGDRKFPCHLCTRSFEKRDRLRIHILHVHEKHRPHKCVVCNKSFSQSSSLNKHMRVHSGERPYKCVYCNKAFTASSILRTHIRQHSGEKPFKCKHCGKAFASHAAHDSHVRRTHARDRQCTCSVCGKSYSQPFELKFHMTIHLNE